MKFFLLSILILSALKQFVLGDVFPVPPGAATDNAARYTVTSSPVPSTDRNISLDFDDVFNDFVQAEKVGKFNYINSYLILAL